MRLGRHFNIARRSGRSTFTHCGRKKCYVALAFAAQLMLLLRATLAAENLGVLGAHPKWKVLEKYQETITHDDFARLIQSVYCTHGFAPDLIAIDEKSARILTNRDA